MPIILTILAFIWWWPIGLLALAFLWWRGGFARRRQLSFAGYEPAFERDHGGDRWERKMARLRNKMERLSSRMARRGGGDGFGPTSSGNSAFDDYRTETLKRLEEEQREFKDFLARLRFAKDRAEFDQFMAERRQHPFDAPAAQPLNS
jgi:hypothetical protein